MYGKNRILFSYFISSFLPGNSDQKTDEEAFCKAKALCEYKIILLSLLYMHKYLLMCPLLLLGILCMGILVAWKKRERERS